MVVWVKDESGRAVRFVDHWTPSFFVATDTKSDLDIPLQVVKPELAWTREVYKREKVTDAQGSLVLEAKVNDAKRIQQVAGRLERLGRFGGFRLYNVDIPPAQSYLYEHDIFPLARCDVSEVGGELQFVLDDDAWEYDYAVPQLRKMKVDASVNRKGKITRFTDELREISLEGGSETVRIDTGSETDKLLRLVEEVRHADPDFIVTGDGDTFLLPFLIKRAEVNGVADGLRIDRDGTSLRAPSKAGTSYFSYGRIHYKPSAIKLHGRIHIDVNSSFAYSEAGFEGLFELSRVCRMPMHTSSRASIGKALSSLQFYHASKSGLLVPWKPTLMEHFKNRNELIVADRGGFIFEPRTGLHEDVAELDFHALYPNIMLRKNISAETVKCACCPDSANRVPELGWNVCEKKGIVPKAIEIIVKKRLGYKERKNRAHGEDYEKYNARQGVLKWLGVTTFGYLGFNNAKFGRIDAHIAVCAWDRKILLDAARVAENLGFEVVHGIVDSLWVSRRRGAGSYLELKSKMEEETGFTMSFEGVYKWIVFLNSKVDRELPVLNRYFGVYTNGELKVRGIEARRHDTPLAFARCQMEILRILAGAGSIREAKSKVGECVDVFLHYADSLRRRDIPPEELAFRVNLSKGPEEYKTMTVQQAAARQLVREGVKLHAGEGIRYVITDYDGHDSRRATPLDTIEGNGSYDVDRYTVLLASTCATVIEAFDPRWTGETLVRTYAKKWTPPLG